jgi:hypothetical protein
MAPINAQLTGCNTAAPLIWANKPVVNGAIAPPLLPNALINAKLVKCSLLGSNFVNVDTTHGYNGPNINPTRETLTAFEMILGIAQTRISKMMARKVRQKTKTRSPPRRGTKGVRKNRPSVIPPQKPEAT